VRVEVMQGIDGESFTEFFEEELPGDGTGCGKIA
jgi:hypothetical protein